MGNSIRLTASIDRLRQLLDVLGARARIRFFGIPPRTPLPSWNGLFHRGLPVRLRREKEWLEAFDVGLFAALNDDRLFGQIVFEYGTLANWIQSWQGLRVLDIGTGRSTLPHWMVLQGATVVSLEHPQPVETKRGGKLGALNDLLFGARQRGIRQVEGDMLHLPFAGGTFDLVTSLSVIEHLDTELPSRDYVPYPEQKRRALRVLDEMIRVTRPGGWIYLTSECCDYAKTTEDAWRSGYYCRNGPAVSAAWPIDEVQELFYDYVTRHGCSLIGGSAFDPRLLDESEQYATYRGRHFSAFSLLARRESSQ